ncbi:uncharacterized protein [Apostichopus japonicus]|uniref:uncharacterized protein isoform X5 n=1 Tax=Stichopus japonicus TaxID=307972 RepID=UPI003AB252FB
MKMAGRQTTERVSSASQLVEAISPYKRPRPQSPHGAHSIFYSPDHRFIQGGGHYTTNLYATAPQRDVRPHMQEMAAMNYQDHHPREMSSYNSLQSQIRRRPSLLSEFHGGAAERERERSGKEFYSRGLDPLRMHTSNHHPDNEISVAKRRRLDIDNDTKFRPVHENSTSTRVVTSSANQPEVKKEPFIPKVENVSPTPCDDESPSKVSKEGLLQAMEKMDREIQMVESQIVNLKKKKQELEQRTSQPREEEKAVADADWEPKQENIVQTIYAENQRKAEDAHKMLSKSGVQNILPLYNQMSDEPNHKEVLKKNYELSRRFILYFKQQAAERNLREKNYCQLYNRRMEAWENRMEKIESNPKKKAKDAKTREFFEKQFPEIRKQREQQERFSSRAGTRSWGNIARSEAELAEIVDGLNEQEANERHMRSLTVIPPMLLEKEQRSVNFVNKNGLVEDAMQEYKDRQRMNMWTNEEREIFREKFSQHPKNFGAIAAFLERKSVPDCVLYYYQNKKRENYKQRKQQVKRKKTLPQKASSSINRNHDDEDKDDKEDGTSQDPKKKDGGDDKEGVNGGGSQNGETSNGPPMSVPTNCALCHHSLDAYTMSRPLSKSNCELLGLNVNEVTANMRVCSKCRFRSLRKSPCPVISCKTARRKAKRLKPLPTKWFEISEEQRSIISQELGIGSEITKCCPACFHRITRRLSNENGPEPDMSSAQVAENFAGTMRKHGKNWMEVAKGIGTKTDLQCENFYKSFRRKHNLDQLMEERPNDDKKREHRVSIAESLGSTITAPSDDDLVVPSSDGENDADESSDTASASENEDGPLRGGGRREKTREQAAVSEKKTENGESVPKDPSGKTNSGNSSGLENEQGLPLVKESDKSLRTASGEGEGKTDLEVVGGGLESQEKPMEEDGDTSATCSADEGNPQDVDMTFSDKAKPPSQIPQGQARDRVSSSEDDTKLSELKAKLEVARTDNKADNSKDSPKASLAETAEKMKTMMAEAQKESEEKSMEGKSWGAQGILNMRDLIDSAIHKHLGQEQRGNEKSPMTDGGVEDETEVPSDKGVETSKPSSTQSLEVPSLSKPIVTSPVPVSSSQTAPKTVRPPTGKTPPTDRHEVKVTVTTAEQTQASAMNKTSHITHTSQVSRDVYEVSSSHRPPPGHKPRLTSSAYMDSLPNRSGGLLLEVAAAHVPSTASMGAMPHVSGIPRGASPRGASPHGAERDQQGHLHSPPGRHNYSPRSTSSSPYALIPATDRHMMGANPSRSLPRTKSTTVPPPPPLINNLSPMPSIKQEKLSPSGGVMPIIPQTGSISQGTPIGYRGLEGIRYEAPGSKAQNERLIMRARSRSPATSSPHHEYTGGSIIQGTPVTRREQTASGRAAGHHQHDRISEKEAAHSKEAYHPKAPRVKLEPPPGPEKGGWGLPMVSYDGLNLELIKSLNERDVALKMSDPSMLYMYTQRHLMQYGGEYGQGMVRGQYASEAYNSSKATLADDFATAQRMNQRMPLPTTSAPSNTRHSPRMETSANTKRGSPAHPHHPMEGIPGLQFTPFGIPTIPTQQGYIMVPQYGMTVATVPHPLHHPFTSLAPSLPSPRSPHTQAAPHPSNPHSNVAMDRKNHSPTVHRAPSPSEVKLSRSWPGQNVPGHFKAPIRGPSSSSLQAPPSGHPYGMAVHRAPVSGGSIMQGTPVSWRQQQNASSGNSNAEMRENRTKSDRGPSPSSSKSQGSSRRVDIYRLGEFNAARKDQMSSIQHENEVNLRCHQQQLRLYGGSRQYYFPEDGRRPHSHSSVPHDNHHHHQQPRRPASGHNREQHPPPVPMQSERKAHHREMELSHPPPHTHYNTIGQTHDRRIKLEKVDNENKGTTSSTGTKLMAAVFEKDQPCAEGKNIKKEHDENSGAFTAATLIDHIIHKSINQPSEDEVQTELVQNNAGGAPPHSLPQLQSSQPKHRSGTRIIDELIVHQIKHESPDEKLPTSQSTPMAPLKNQGGGAKFNYNERGGGHAQNHIDSSLSTSSGMFRHSTIPAPSRTMTIGDHINSIVSNFTHQKVSSAECVDSTTAHRGLERSVNEMGFPQQKSPRPVNDSHSMKGNRTLSPGDAGSRADSTVKNFSKRSEPGPDHKEFQSGHIDSTAGRGVPYPISSKESKETAQSRASPRETIRNLDAGQIPGGYSARIPHSERDFVRGQMSRPDSAHSRTSCVNPNSANSAVYTMAHFPPQNTMKPQLSSSAAINFSRDNMTTSVRPSNFQESINRMIERQVRANDGIPQEEEVQERRPVSRGHESVRQVDAYKRNMTIAQMQGGPPANGPPKSLSNKQDLVANKENNMHSSAVMPNPGGHLTMMPSASHPSMMPGNYAYPLVAYMPNHQPQSGVHPAAAGIHTSPTHMASVPRASPLLQASQGVPRRDEHHTPLLSSEYECLSDDE